MAADIREEIANYLLNNCFVVGTEDSMREKYYYILNHEEAFQDVFKPIGYTLVINRGLKVVQVVNNHDIGRVSLKKYESIILFILRLLFVEKREKLSTNADKVLATVSEIKQEYDKLNLPKKFDQKLIEDAIYTLSKFNLATKIGRLENTEAKVQIFPSVMMALSDNSIDAQYSMIKEKLHAYENSEDDES